MVTKKMEQLVSTFKLDVEFCLSIEKNLKPNKTQRDGGMCTKGKWIKSIPRFKFVRLF